MMSEPKYAQAAARALKLGAPVAEREDSLEAQRATLMAMAAALEQRQASRRRRAVAMMAIAASIVAAVVSFAPWQNQSASPTVVAQSSSLGTISIRNASDANGQHTPLSGGASIAASARLTTPESGAASLSFSTGTRVELAPKSDLTVEALGAHQRLYLANGRVVSHVAHLAGHERFVVATRDAEVEVRGTAFTVDVAPADPSCGIATTTRVSVDEGVVEVRFNGTTARVRAGERWPSSCADAAGNGGDLSQQNDVFARASALKQQGDVQAAASLFAHLARAWPSGPLAESAAAERLKVLAAAHAHEAHEAACEYQAAHPQGFAATEAAALCPPSR